MTGWIVAALMVGLVVGVACGMALSYVVWRWYEGRPLELAVKPVVRSRVLDSAVYPMEDE